MLTLTPKPGLNLDALSGVRGFAQTIVLAYHFFVNFALVDHNNPPVTLQPIVTTFFLLSGICLGLRYLEDGARKLNSLRNV